MSLPLIRAHERIDYKRCPKKWYWKWRKGLVLKGIRFGALELGQWVHSAFDAWYDIGNRRVGELVNHFNQVADWALETASANNVPSHIIEKGEEAAELGAAMMRAYQDHYGLDPDIDVIGGEVPLSFALGADNQIVAHHMLKPDQVFRWRSRGGIWLMEHKTAASVQTEHLVIDDQARPYGAMAERALRKAGIIGKHDRVRGILYNFIRKAIPDNRMTNEKGQYLNKNGTVSARQPKPYFVRKPVTLTAKAKAQTLKRILVESTIITQLTQGLHDKTVDPDLIPKTPHKSCPKFCDYFSICTAEENGTDIREMERLMFVRQNPYDYGESTDEPISFEMG